MVSITFLVLSFLASFKAILIEGSEVTIIALTTIKKLGKRNVLAGLVSGIIVVILLYLILENIFSLFPSDYVSIVAGIILLYFAYRFGRGFYRYYFKGGNFELKMKKEEEEIVAKSLNAGFNRVNIIPMFFATLVEGTEATLIIAASGAFSPQYAIFGAITGILVLVAFAAVSYRYLMKLPRWALDLIAFTVLTVFGIIFIVSGILNM
ncbi:MAG: hypothetical protein JHC29_06860 [Thermoplasmata archaeon]|jgi:uncharacterized membrane protein|nr:hypothetical protein [Thermoplasmata archaeon]MVT12817.1 hypothetical protein [Euryarchaeota archaeon]